MKINDNKSCYCIVFVCFISTRTKQCNKVPHFITTRQYEIVMTHYDQKMMKYNPHYIQKMMNNPPCFEKAMMDNPHCFQKKMKNNTGINYNNEDKTQL